MMEQRLQEIQQIDKETNTSAARRDVQLLYMLLRKSHRAIAVSWIVSFNCFTLSTDKSNLTNPFCSVWPPFKRVCPINKLIVTLE